MNTPAETRLRYILRKARPTRSTRDRNRPTTISTWMPKYSWLKTPRYDGKPMEVGPLAKALVVGYAAGQEGNRRHGEWSAQSSQRSSHRSVLHAGPHRRARARSAVDGPPARRAGSTSLARTWPMARRLFSTPSAGTRVPGRQSASGHGWHEAPRGSLGHWVEIATANRSRTTRPWFLPRGTPGHRDAPQGQRGAYEAALLNYAHVADPNRPLEILRTIHSFDPCIACAVHVIDAQGREYTIPRVA